MPSARLGRVLVVPPEAYRGTEYQRRAKIPMSRAFPHRSDGLCRCGCNRVIVPPARCWARPECNAAATQALMLILGDPGTVRAALRKRDKGVCARCGLDTYKARREYLKIEFKLRPLHPLHKWPCRSWWDAHHVIPVSRGGARLGLSNFETVCIGCHKLETKALRCRARVRCRVRTRI